MFRRLFLLFICSFFCCCEFDEENAELCFIGDSITYLWDVEYYFPNYVITKHAVSGAQLFHVDQWNVENCRKKTTVLLIGTNDIGSLKSTDQSIDSIRASFGNSFFRTAKKIDADPLIVVSILPRNFLGEQDPLVNVNLKEQNEIIRKMIAQNIPNSVFIDVFDKFLYRDFEIREDLFKDGLHPNDGGYEILAREIQKKL